MREREREREVNQKEIQERILIKRRKERDINFNIRNIIFLNIFNWLRDTNGAMV